VDCQQENGAEFAAAVAAAAGLKFGEADGVLAKRHSVEWCVRAASAAANIWRTAMTSVLRPCCMQQLV
jgi:hypothetical protein